MFSEAIYTLPSGESKRILFQKNGYPINAWRAPPRKGQELLESFRVAKIAYDNLKKIEIETLHQKNMKENCNNTPSPDESDFQDEDTVEFNDFYESDYNLDL